MPDYAEKRNFQRMAIDCALRICKKDEHQSFEGHVINLSSTGILFTSTENFDKGISLDIVLTPSNSLTPPMEATAVVTRVINNDAVYEVACEIGEIK